MISINRRWVKILTILLVFLGGVLSCSVTQHELQPITYVELTNNMLEPAKPLQNSSFMPTGESGTAHHEFSGGLVLSAIEMKARPEFKSRDVLGKDPKIFPGVTLHFFSHQGDLVPVTRDVITPEAEQAKNSFWEIIVQPGKTWAEPGDNGWSRASFPFALMNSLENDTHNGIATFLFNESEVSAVRFQIVTQTAPYYITNHFVAWGQIPAKYDPTPIDNLEELKKAYEMEKTNKFPKADWSILEQKVGKEKLAGFEGRLYRSYLVWSALVYDGVLYYKPCKTKFGDYPYTQNMRVGVWSVTKSVAAGIGMLKLAQKYGPRVFDLKIKDYVKITADHNGWEEVTFGDAVNMATGIAGVKGGTNRANNIFVDYGPTKSYREWYSAPSAEEKIQLISKCGNYPWGPREVARYRDRDMFILGAAMDSFLKSVEGPNADIWKMVAEEVFKPIHIYHAPINRTVEPDRSLGLPITAWGWYPTLDDLAKVTDLLHRRGVYEGQQLLHLEKTEDLFSTRGSLRQGVRSDYGEKRYKIAFHYEPFPDHSGKLMYLPYMLGWVGNIVILMPGDMTGIRISNAWPARGEVAKAVNNPTRIAKIGNRLKPFYAWSP